MKKWMVWMLVVLLGLGGAVAGVAEEKKLPTIDIFVDLYSLFAPLLEQEAIGLPEIFSNEGDDIAMVFLENDVALIFSFVTGTRELSQVMVLAATVQTDTEALGTFLYSSILTVQAAHVMTDAKEIMAMLQEFGMTDAESIEKGVRGSREVDGILIDLLIDGEVGGVLRLSNPE